MSSRHIIDRSSRQHRRRARVLTQVGVLVGLSWLAAACGEYGGGGSDSVLLSGAGAASGGLVGGANSGATVEEDVAAFEQTVFPLMRNYCVDCHAGAGPGSPSIAHFDAPTAHFAVVQNQKVNLGSPIASRLVQRLAVDLHYCWSSCVQDAEAVRAAIEAWAQIVNYGGSSTQVSGSLSSSSQQLADGVVVDPANDRYQQNLVALWEFKEGSGNIAADSSGVDPAIDLTLEGTRWLSSYGIAIEDGMALAGSATSEKLFDAIANPNSGTNQYTVEAWIVPANITQEGPARIISYSRGTGNRNFMMAQVQYNYVFRNRSISGASNNNGVPALETYDDDRDLQAVLQHAVMTYDPYRGRKIFVNGVFTDDIDEVGGGQLWNWDPNYEVVIGNETSNNRLWLGEIRYAAIYKEALNEAQIQQNFDAGVGKRVIVQFDISQWTSPGTTIELVVSELDDYSYLLCTPTFTGPASSGVRVKNIRIAVNGQIPVNGQAFTNIDTGVFESTLELSRQCSVIAKDLGPGLDVFSLEFEDLGTYQDPVQIVNPPIPVDNSVAPPLPELGIRAFARLNDSMSSLTGVDSGDAAIDATFVGLQQQLPSTFDLRAFVTSQQVGISKLALEYCDALVETPSLRDAFFGTTPPFEFDSPVPTAFSDSTKRDQISNALLDKLIGVNIADQPLVADTWPVLDTLILDLTNGCDPVTCDAQRTRDVVKGVCAAVLASGAVSIH